MRLIVAFIETGISVPASTYWAPASQKKFRYAQKILNQKCTQYQYHQSYCVYSSGRATGWSEILRKHSGM